MRLFFTTAKPKDLLRDIIKPIQTFHDDLENFKNERKKEISHHKDAAREAEKNITENQDAHDEADAIQQQFSKLIAFANPKKAA